MRWESVSPDMITLPYKAYKCLHWKDFHRPLKKDRACSRFTRSIRSLTYTVLGHWYVAVLPTKVGGISNRSRGVYPTLLSNNVVYI